MAEGMQSLLGLQAVPAASSAQAKPQAKGGQDTLRIATHSLDQLLQSSGQLVMEAARQERLEAELTTLAKDIEVLRRVAHGNRADESEFRLRWREMSRRLQHARALQQRATRSLRILSRQTQDTVRRICMVPVGSVFEAFPKMMRDLAAEMAKPVRFVMTGTEYEADRAVLQALKDPVMHALRNALSHGIEPAAARRAAGKAAEGEVSLHVSVSGHRLQIRVADDGRGVDLPKVRQAAVSAKLADLETAAQLTDEQLMGFIFHPGFSTSPEVTTVSGRGVGLSVVRERAAQMQGFVRMTSTHGGGSTLLIEVPVTISTYWLMLVRTGAHVLAIPVSAIQSLARVRDVYSAEGKSVIMWRDRPTPLTTAAETVGEPSRLVRSDDGHVLVAVLHAAAPLALQVDAFVGEVSALIHPLPFPASRSAAFAGGVRLEDGSVALVLNVETLVSRFRGATLVEEPRQTQTHTQRQTTVLVVDDSFTARTLQKSILETAGYLVRVAVDGRAAMEILRSVPVDVVVSDVQMPHMDGFELLATMKNQASLAEIPVVLVTSLGGKADQERGLSLGADAYIVKERFDHTELLSVVRQLAP
jgi:two-component system chemotaxis sensor kinase CheA